MAPVSSSRLLHAPGFALPVVELLPADLLDPQGFTDGTLCDGLPAQLGQRIPRDVSVSSMYASGRHLLRHLVHTHVLPLFPWCAEFLFEQQRKGSPVRVWLYDADGCPLRSHEEELRSHPPVKVSASALSRALADVYPLTRSSEVRVYDALDLPEPQHLLALAAVLPLRAMDEDVLRLAAELLLVTGEDLRHRSLGAPTHATAAASIAASVDEAVASARLLLR